MSNNIQILPKHLNEQLNAYFKDDKRSSIEKLGSLNHLITIAKIDTQLLHFDAETLKELTTIYHNNPESLLLYFATDGNSDWIRIALPINDQLDLVASIATTTEYDAWQDTYLQHRDSDMIFDLTHVDAYQEDDDEDETEDDQVRFIKTYLYGNPHSEDWTKVKRTNFADIYEAVEINRE